MAVPVTVFNASPLAVQVNVNNSAQSFTIPGASAAIGYVPQAPQSGGPTWNSRTPGPNQLGLGTNYLSVTPNGSPYPTTMAINLSPSVNWMSLQLYFFLDQSGGVNWAALNNGSWITSGHS